MPTFSSQLLFLSDRLQQLKDALALENITGAERKHLESQVRVVESAVKNALEEEHERRRRQSLSQHAKE